MGNLFGGGTPKPAATIVPSPTMPDPDTSGMEARRKAQRDALARAGRGGTILTTRRPATAPAAPTPGYDTYAGTKLG